MEALVAQKDLPPRPKRAFPLVLIGNFTITALVMFIALADVVIWIYQEIYFSIFEIPKVPRSKFVLIDRYKLIGLTPLQKWNCAYCEYTNGVIAWAKAIANQTEVYSCAIKYSHRLPGQEYQKDFYEQEKFNRE